MIEPALFVLFLRITVPLLILRWNFVGGLLSILIDANDVKIIRILGGELWPNYHTIDKVLDMHFLIIAFIVVYKWKGIKKNFGVALFSIRSVGFLLFELTGARYFLFLFPNVFEFWFLFWSYLKDFRKDFEPTTKQLVIIVSFMTIIKVLQEILLHIINNCDKYIYCGAELLLK